MELGRWDEASTRLIDSLDRDPEYEPLKEMAARLLSDHPQPDELRAWLSQELARPEHVSAAMTIGPMLSTAD